MHKPQQQVRDLHRAIEHPAPSKLTALDEARRHLRLNLIAEEFSELMIASGGRMYLSLPDGQQRVTVDSRGDVNLPEQVDGLCDLLVVTYGMAVEMGVDLEPFFDEVHRTNMAKAGGPVAPSGKRLKPEGWTPPDIAGLLKKLHGVG